MSDASSPTSTLDLLPRIARGDAGAVRECLDRYAGLVWSLARRFSTTNTDAEDAVQDIFLEVWKSAERFDASVASEATFIAMIARRRLIDRRRKESRRPAPQALSPFTDIETSSLPVEHPAQHEEDIAAARSAMAQLSPDQRRVLQLSVFHGLSHDRIARTTGLPLGTVKTNARRGLIRIREIIEAQREGAGPDGRERP